MAVGAAVASAVTGIGGTILSAVESSKARKSNRHERNFQRYAFNESMMFEREKWEQFEKDLRSRREALHRERIQRRNLAARKFDAAMKDYELRSKALDKTIAEYKKYEEDPLTSPHFRRFSEALGKEASKMIKTSSKELGARGRFGGAQAKLRTDISEALLTKLGTEMLRTQEDARMKVLELEGERPQTPFLEFYGDPELGAGIPQSGATLPRYNPNFQMAQPIDLSGFGQAAASIYDAYSNRSQQGQTSLFNDYSWRTWDTAGYSTASLTPRQKLLGV